jgi:GIY-YIG catalytic domain.
VTIAPDEPHALYRFYGAGGTLLYIGITNEIPRRLKDHSRNKPWWLGVTNIKVEHYPNRQSVLEAERRAIIAERPLYNDQHNPMPLRRIEAWDAGLDRIRELMGDREVAELVEEVQEEGYSGAHLAFEVALLCIDRWRDEGMTYYSAFVQLRNQLPDEMAAAVRAKADDLGVGMGSAEVHEWMADLVAADYAQRYLQTLPPAEVEDWKACGSRFHTGEQAILRQAAILARGFKADGYRPRHLCSADGPHGTICPRPKTLTASYVDCRTCEGECAGHTDYCDDHLAIAVDGGLRWVDDGSVAVVSEIRDAIKSDPWEF